MLSGHKRHGKAVLDFEQLKECTLVAGGASRIASRLKFMVISSMGGCSG